ncbi:MAG: glycerate kinase [Clostridia bacterium]|nr:glycerate kinase [Clostridia bacterium]
MKIVVASDSYKGSCTTLEVADAIEKGIRKVIKDADIIKIPVADGGEGTVDALVLGTNGIYDELEVLGPLGNKVKAKYGILDNDIAVIEMAAASGLTLVEESKRDPMISTTYGTGQLIKAAIDRGCKKILVGIGGSATNDGGAGMAQALGYSLVDKDGKEIGHGGKELCKLHKIETSCVHPKLRETEIIVISDVSNPLCGFNGAAYVYGPQKGATPNMVKQLDYNLRHYASIIKKFLHKDIFDIPGAGAAGGLGAGLMTFCNAELYSGIDKILDITNIDKHLVNADLVIVGEGQIGGQSIYGKAPVGVAQRAVKYDVPVLAIVGGVGEGATAVYAYGVDVIMDIINKPMTLNEAIKNASILIEQTAECAMRALLLGSNRIKRRGTI